MLIDWLICLSLSLSLSFSLSDRDGILRYIHWYDTGVCGNELSKLRSRKQLARQRRDFDHWSFPVEEKSRDREGVSRHRSSNAERRLPGFHQMARHSPHTAHKGVGVWSVSFRKVLGGWRVHRQLRWEDGLLNENTKGFKRCIDDVVTSCLHIMCMVCKYDILETVIMNWVCLHIFSVCRSHAQYSCEGI